MLRGFVFFVTSHPYPTYFPQQINLFSSAIQFVFLSNSICFPQQINLFSSAIQLKLVSKFNEIAKQTQ